MQLADGYRSRALAFARTARTQGGMAAQQDYLARSADAYRQAIDLYSRALGYADARRSLRVAQHGLEQVEQQRRVDSSIRPGQPRPMPPFRLSSTRAVQQ